MRKADVLTLAAATQYFWLAESIGLLPLASSFCLVVYAIDKPIKKEQTMEIENEVTRATQGTVLCVVLRVEQHRVNNTGDGSVCCSS